MPRLDPIDALGAADAPALDRHAAARDLVRAGRLADAVRSVCDALGTARTAATPGDEVRQVIGLATAIADATRAAAVPGGAAARAALSTSLARVAADATERRDGLTVFRAAAALAEVCDDRERAFAVVSATRRACDDGGLDGPRGSSWAGALARFGLRERDDLLAWHHSGDMMTRFAAATAWPFVVAATAPDASWAADRLFEALSDREGFVADGAMYHFRHAAPFAAGLVPELGRRIVSDSDDDDDDDARRAIIAAGLLGPGARALVGGLRVRSGDEGTSIPAAARHAILRITDDADEAALRGIAAGIVAGDVEAYFAVETLGGRVAPIADVLVARLPDLTPGFRATFCESLAATGDRTVVPPLLEVLSGAMSSQSAEDDVYRGHATSSAPEDTSDIAAAARGLARLGAKEALPALAAARRRTLASTGDPALLWVLDRASASLAD